MFAALSIVGAKYATRHFTDMSSWLHSYFRTPQRNSLNLKYWARFLVGKDYSVNVRAHFQVSNWNFNSAPEQLSQSGVISERSLSNFIFYSDPDRNIINHKGTEKKLYQKIFHCSDYLSYSSKEIKNNMGNFNNLFQLSDVFLKGTVALTGLRAHLAYHNTPWALSLIGKYVRVLLALLS